MKTVSHKLPVIEYLKYGVCALAVAATISLPVTAYGGDTGTVPPKVEKQVQKNTQDQTADKRKEVTADAMAALTETSNALKALDEGKKREALSALERATGKLDIILAREPKLSLAPTGVSTLTYDIYGSIDAVKEARKQALELMQEGRVQDARQILKNLASEDVIYVNNLPLASYPEAIKLAVKDIDDGKIEDAKKVLQTALNTLVVTQTIIPLPVIRAQQLLKQAEAFAEKKDRKPEDNRQLSDLLASARHEIEIAEALGYGTKKDFVAFYEQIDQIEDKTSNGKFGIGFFEKIKSAMVAMLDESKRPSQDKVDKTLKVNN